MSKIRTITTGVLFLIAVGFLDAAVPQSLLLNGLAVSNYPNPFDSRDSKTTIVYSVAEPADVKIKIYDLFGNLVREYTETRNTVGLNEVAWDGTNMFGQKVAKGGYICSIEVCYNGKPIVLTRKIGVIH